MQRKQPLRARATLEKRLWARLREMEGYRFRRKSPFRTFILDFIEHDAGLVISLEDRGHPSVKQASGHIVRDRLLSEQGYVILRLDRAEVARDVSGALHRIKSVLQDIAAFPRNSA
jgi:very-short-patch-repair endonuclease